jgi:hypothetical protein
VMRGMPDGGEPVSEARVGEAAGRLILESARPPAPKTEEEVQRLYKYGFLNLHAASNLLAAMKRKRK